MKREEVKKLVIEKYLGSKRGVNVYLSKDPEETKNTIISNWTGDIKAPTNDVNEKKWFAFADLDPNANFEHPVEYLFISDNTGNIEVVRGTSPPSNMNSLERIL